MTMTLGRFLGGEMVKSSAFQQFFVENLPELIDAALSEQVRPFRRREACALIGCLLNKDGVSVGLC